MIGYLKSDCMYWYNLQFVTTNGSSLEELTVRFKTRISFAPFFSNFGRVQSDNKRWSKTGNKPSLHGEMILQQLRALMKLVNSRGSDVRWRYHVTITATSNVATAV
mmetsp:Transcript_34494/g.58520  ORF Transcript_34494/g.58520 Transcript_34494/m.58520 type:complete len:106 (-) Transcript_34494:215-532(-)